MKKIDNITRDKLLVSRMHNGEESAFSEIMDLYYDAIFFTTLRIVNNKNDAEDLTAEVFSKVFSNLDKYSEEFAFSTWLFRIATNLGIDFLRKRKRHFISIDEDKSDQSEISIPSTHLGPEEILINKQTANELSKVVEELKPFWAQLIDMRYYKELSYEEIADQLDIPLGTIKSQLYRAKQSLAKRYKNR